MNKCIIKQSKTWRQTFVAAGLVGALALSALAANAEAPDGPGIAATTSASVRETVSKLKEMVSANGMMVMSEINQGKALSMTGAKLESQTLFVGNPQIGKMLFEADPGAGAVVPVRINVYQDKSGKTVVRFIPPSGELDHFHNPQVTQIGKMLDEKHLEVF